MSQRTIPLPSTHPLQAMQGLSRVLALPHEFAPVRLPSFPALERTALMGFSAPASLSIPASSTIKVGMMRQAAYPSWAEQASTQIQSVNVSYESVSQNVNNLATNSLTWALSSVISFDVGNLTATAYVPGCAGCGAVEWKYPIIGRDSGTGSLPWVYVPRGANLAVTVAHSNTVLANGFATVALAAWNAPGETRDTVEFNIPLVAGNRGASTNSTAVFGWVRPLSVNFSEAMTVGFNPTVSLRVSNAAVTYTPSVANAGSFAMGALITTPLFMPLVYPAEFANSRLPWLSTRTTAASALYTNVSQVLNKGGTVLAGRVAPSAYAGSMWELPQTYVQTLHPAEKAFLGLETGHYTYVPPSTDLVDFWDYSVSSTGILAASLLIEVPVVRLDNSSLYNVAFITASAVAEQLAVTIDWHIEFRTSSALFQIGLSTTTLEVLHQAQIALASVGYFFENFNHKALLNMVTGAAKKYGPAALSLIPHPAAKAASMIFSSRPSSGPKTTTANASGMNGPGKRQKVVVKGKKVKVAGKKR